MITLKPNENKEIVKKYFDDNGFKFSATSGVLEAKCAEEILGFCLYYLDKEGMEILKLSPNDDLSLADGILRSTIHLACERFILNVSYGENADISVFEKLNFIKDKEKRLLDADKLFGGCNCHN